MHGARPPRLADEALGLGQEGRVAARIPRPQCTVGPPRVDQRRAEPRVVLGEQRRQRHLHLPGVAVVLLAIRIGQLDRLHHRVQVVPAVVSRAREVEVFQQRERLQQHRALVPGAALEDPRIVEVQRGGLLDVRREGLQVAAPQQPVLLAHVALHLRGDVAAVERVVHGLQAIHAAAAGLLLRRAERVEERGVGGVAEQAALRRHRTVGQVDRPGGGPVAQQLVRQYPQAVARLAHETLVHGKALRRIVPRGAADLRKGQAAELAQCGQQGAQRRGDAHHQGAFRGQVRQAPLQVGLRRGELRRGGIAVDGHHPARTRVVDQHRALAAQRVHVGVDHALHERGADGGVHGVAAGLEDVRRRLGGQVVLRGHGTAGAHQPRQVRIACGVVGAEGAGAHGRSGAPRR